MQNEQALANLSELGKKLCRGAKVSIVQCNAEFTDSSFYGTLKGRLERHLGNGVTVETWEGLCALRWGKPTEWNVD